MNMFKTTELQVFVSRKDASSGRGGGGGVPRIAENILTVRVEVLMMLRVVVAVV